MKMSNNDLAELLYDQYIENSEPDELSKLIPMLDQLVKSRQGIVIKSSEYYSSAMSINYRVACKYIQKFNKEIKKNRRKPYTYEYGDTDYTWSVIDPKLMHITKCILDDGIYIAQINSKNYCILDIKSSIEDSRITTNLYFIGKKWKKQRSKYEEYLDKYKEVAKFKEPDMIYTCRGSSDAIFKSFDKFVMKDKNSVLKYIDNWIENIPNYHEKYEMIPKLSILLYGDPGTGKSTFYKALAKYLDINTVQIVDINYLMSNNNRGRMKAIYAIDDIDCLCTSRKDIKKNNDNDHVLSTLLEFLDNPPVFMYKAKDGINYPIQIVVATTNYYDKLDPAVKRYGRFDLQIEMKDFNKNDAQTMCDMYNLKLSDIIRNSDKKNFRISPAKLQALCLNNLDAKFKTGLTKCNGLIKISKRKSFL